MYIYIAIYAIDLSKTNRLGF